MEFPPDKPAPSASPDDAEATARSQAAVLMAKPAAAMAASAQEMAMYRQRRKIQRRWLWGLAIVAVAGSLFVPGAFTRWRRDRNLRIAEQAAQRGDMAGAIFALRVAAAAGADGARFHRLTAELAAQRRDPAGLSHRRQVAALEPTRANFLAWADDALAVNDTSEARQAVARLAELGHDAASRLRQARLALSLGDRATALHSFREAAADPTTQAEAILGEGAIRMTSSAPEERREGEQLLRQAAEVPATEIPALESLLAAAAQDRAIPALGPARQLLGRRDAPLAGHLLAVRFLAILAPMEGDAALRAIQTDCRDQPGKMTEVAKFMVAQGQAKEALAWLTAAASVEQCRQLPLAVAMVSALSQLGRWDQIETLLQRAQWSSDDSFRLLTLAQASRMQANRQAAKQVREAIAVAKDQPETLQRLFLQAEAWSMVDAALEIGQAILRLPRVEKAMGERIYALSVRSDDPSALPRFYEAILAAHPQDEKARLNLALLNLLAGKSTHASARIAREAADRNPNASLGRLTLALALGRENRAKDGLTELTKIPEAERTDLFTGIRAVLLAWAGQRGEADVACAGLDPRSLPPSLRELLQARSPMPAATASLP